jgi:hypothetical protein
MIAQAGKDPLHIFVSNDPICTYRPFFPVPITCFYLEPIHLAVSVASIGKTKIRGYKVRLSTKKKLLNIPRILMRTWFN